ncbi:MAG: DUF1080 domain-containing protein [Planctomycetia bacterium]|nr:DUF1080 domain-containing protein [Planctomycetia bacterium]
MKNWMIALSACIMMLVSVNVFAQDTAAKCSCNALSGAEQKLGFKQLFDGTKLCPKIWQGSIDGYPVDTTTGTFSCQKGGQLMTIEEYDNFVFRFEFKLPPKGNNGVGIRTKLGVNPAYDGMEIQILGDDYVGAKDWQKHGSIYGVVPAKTGALKPNGQWNTEEIVALGTKIKVTVNGQVIVDTDIANAAPVDGHKHPGLLNKSGVVGFLGHNDPVVFRNVRIKKIVCEECLKKIADAEKK